MTGSTPAKLSNGGGEGMLHSRVVACQGFISVLFFPLHKLQTKLKRKMRLDGGAIRLESGIAAVNAKHAEPVHGHEDRVDADKGEPEVDFAEAFAQEAAEHLREPEEERTK